MGKDKHVTLIGSVKEPSTIEIEEWLTRNRQSFVYVDFDTQRVLVPASVKEDALPVCVCGDNLLVKPTVSDVAQSLGLSAFDSRKAYDLLVIGAGPAGLGAGIYAASEGLDTLIAEAYAPGGQAGTSSRIENYMGFPEGISGLGLTAAAVDQATKFGATLAVARSATKLITTTRPYEVDLGNFVQVRAKALVIATGAKYNKLDVTGKYDGSGVYYAATPVEANRIDESDEVVIVGGGNSAGQAAMFLSEHAKQVHVLVRGQGLSDTMSHYLVSRIMDNPKVTIHPFTTLVEVKGSGHVEGVVFETAGQRAGWAVKHVFIMTGAKPNTAWLNGAIALDDHGFVLTGYDLGRVELIRYRWPLERIPFLYETSLPGVFAVGDVRSGSVKRVASAAGEGGSAIQFVHKTLLEVNI